MKKIFQITQFAMISGLFITLSGCGGSSSDNKDPVPDENNGDTTIVGYLTDSAVAGLTYTTATQSGTTGDNGAFTYEDGETITFSLGDITIGETVAAKEDMTPLDLIPGAVLYTTNKQVEKMLSADSTAPERIAFFKLANTLTFLQSLDEDSNPDNGISIPAGISDVLAGRDINFEEDNFSDFKRKLLSVTIRATNLELLDSGAVKPMGYALDHFYSAQNISQNFMAIAITNFDNDTEDDQVSSDETIEYTYDDNGNKLTSNSEVYDAGTLSYSFGTTYTYDANGNMLTQESNNDGVINEYNSYEYEFDANGNILKENAPYGTGNYSYFDNGNLQSVSYIEDDETFTNTFTYDDKDNIKTSTFGDITITYTYDTNNKITKAVKVGGSETNTLNITYDSNGNLVSINNGSEDVFTNTYDANGNLLTEYANGQTYTYTYYDNSNLKTYTYIGGSTTNTYNYTYDDNGSLQTKSQDYNGVPITLNTYTYDTNGNLLTDVAEYNLNTSSYFSNTTTYTYDEYGNKLTESVDRDSDNPLHKKVTSTLISSNWTAVLFNLNQNIHGDFEVSAESLSGLLTL
jgi:hypothetical protein